MIQFVTAMSCDYCFVVYNLAPGQHVTPRGSTFPSTSFFFRPFDSTFTFGEKQLSDDHVHVTMPIKIPSAFSGIQGDLLVNSSRNFVIFNPIKTSPLTFQEALFPSDETHEPVVAIAPSHHRICPGSVVVGVDTSRQGDIFVCFVYFLNGVTKHAEIPAITLIYNSSQVISHFKKMESELRKKIDSPWMKIAFKGSVLVYGDKLKSVMPPKSAALLLKEAQADPKRTADGAAAPKRAKTDEK